jgi:hypothetical protein
MTDTTLDLLRDVLAIPLDSEDLHAELQAVQDRIRETLDDQKRE